MHGNEYQSHLCIDVVVRAEVASSAGKPVWMGPFIVAERQKKLHPRRTASPVHSAAASNEPLTLLSRLLRQDYVDRPAPEFAPESFGEKRRRCGRRRRDMAQCVVCSEDLDAATAKRFDCCDAEYCDGCHAETTEAGTCGECFAEPSSPARPPPPARPCGDVKRTSWCQARTYKCDQPWYQRNCALSCGRCTIITMHAWPPSAPSPFRQQNNATT